MIGRQASYRLGFAWVWSVVIALSGCSYAKSDIKISDHPPLATDGSTPDDAATDDASGPLDAAKPAKPPSHIDAGPYADVDASCDDGADCEDPCSNGTFSCELFEVKVASNWIDRLPSATVVLTLEGYRFEVPTLDSMAVASLQLPSGRVLWAHAEAAGHRPTDAPFLVDTARGFGIVLMFSDQYLREYAQGAGIEEAPEQATVVEWVDPPPQPTSTLGAGLEINKGHAGPFVIDEDQHAVLGNVICPGCVGGVVFLNVEPGPVIPTFLSPPGFDCSLPPEIEYRSVAGAVLTLSVWCQALPADADSPR